MAGKSSRFSSATHEDRVAWLTARAAQTYEHPCDCGVLGAMAGALSIPILFAGSAVGSAAGACVGAVAWSVLRLQGQRVNFSQTINNTNTWYMGLGTAMACSNMPAMTASFHIATQLGLLSIDGGSFVAMWLTLQVARLATGVLKLGITAVGAVFGLGIGLAATGVRAARASEALTCLTSAHWAVPCATLRPSP